MQQKFNVVIGRDSKGWLVASVPSLHGCHTQARSFDELDLRIKEAIFLCLEDEEDFPLTLGPGILLKILRDLDLTREDLLPLL